MRKILMATAILVMSTTAFAEAVQYNCYSYYWNGDQHEKGTMALSVDGDTATADILEELWDKNLGGKLDPKYKSKGPIKFNRFGRELILEEALVKGGRTLDDGSLGGIARVEGEAEGGFYQYKFICKR